MRIDIPEYNTFVDFPDTMDMEHVKSVVREKFPPLVSTLLPQPSEGVPGKMAEEIVSPLGKDYTQPPSFTEKAKKALATLAGAVAGEGYIGSTDQTAEEGINRVVEAGKQTTEALTHTARGFAAWPIAKVAGLYINATFGAEMAKKAEEGIMHAVTGEPQGEEARNLFETIGTVAGAPFIPAQFIGGQIGKIQPELGYAIGTGLEFATPMIGHYGIKRLTQFGRIYKAIKEGKEIPSAERSVLENMPENDRMAAMVAVELAKEESPRTLIEEFKKNGIPEKDAVEFVETIAEEPIKPEMSPVETEGLHRPMTVEGGAARLYDLEPAFGPDIYGDNAIRYFGTGEKFDIQTLRILKSVRDKPEKDVIVYRAVPKDEPTSILKEGDWVTVNKQYAKEHGEGILGGDYKIIEQKVKAKDLTTNADSFNEQGYYPELAKTEPTPKAGIAREPRQLLEDTFANPTPDNINALMDMALNYTRKTKVYTGPRGGGRFRREIQGWRTFADAIGEKPGKPDPRWKELGFTSARDFVDLTHDMKFKEKAKQIFDDPDFPSEKTLQAVEDYAILKEDRLYEQADIDPNTINEIEQAHKIEIAGRKPEERLAEFKELTRELSEEPVVNQQGELVKVPFTLSGNQPVSGKSFIKPEIRGERLPGMPQKATTQEIIERINKQQPSEYEKTIADISKEVSDEITIPPPGKAKGLTIETVGEIPINKKKSMYSFDDPSIEASYRAAHGVPKRPVLDTVKEILTSVWEDITRTYKHLPNDERFYPAQVILKRQEKAFNKASYETLNALRGETHKFDTYQMDVYSRKVLLDDLLETSEKGKNIPFGFTEETLNKELARINVEVAKDSAIQKALERRQKVQKSLIDEYTGLRKYFGDDVSGKFKNENYYRHQVLEYAQVKGLSGTGEGMKVPTWRGFLKERKGSELPINTDYLQAEYEWRAQMVYDVQTLRTLKALDEQYNIIKALKKQAKQTGVEWQSLVPEGYVEWQARKGNIFYTTDTVPAKIAEQLRDGAFEEIGITAEDLRQTLSIGGKRKQMVVPEELAKTLDEFGQSKPENGISRFSKNILTSWKVWTLVSPTRFFKYNIRNMTGDADAGFVGNKSGFTKTPEAVKDLYGVMFYDKPMEGKLKDFFDRSGFDTTLQAQEMGDINGLRAFKNLADEHGGFEKIPGKVWNGYWKAARVTTDFRELMLRYANYIDYLEQIEKGGGKPKNYGASDPKKIDALKDYKDKAYELSNDLLGAYDRISVTGQYIRGHIFPFWSWKEMNFKRYVQLFKNAAGEGTLATTIGHKVLGTVTNPYTAFRVGSFIAKATTLWSVMQVWNNLMFPNEEKELSPDVKGRPHIILGRDENGKIIHFSRIGALGDFLEWFGLDAAPQTVNDWLSGKKTLLETAEDMAKNPVNTVVQGINPFVKVPFELAMRQSIFPDVFKTGMIRDRGLYLARSLGLENEYKAVVGIPYEGFVSTLPQIFYYKADPGQGAYSEIQSLKRDFMEKIGKGYDGWMLTPKGQALYNIKLAIRYKDEEALLKSLEEYVALGGNNQGFKESIKAMEPLHGLKPKEQKAFIESLSVEDLERLEKAEIFYEKTLKGGLQ